VDGCAGAQLERQALKQEFQVSHIEGTILEYSVDEKRYFGLLLRAANSAPKAAVVLLPDWRGQGSLARDHANYLVSLGCTVAIADLYGNGFSPDSPDQVGPMVKSLLEHRAQGVAGLSACVEQLRQEVPAGTAMLCLGFSAGGMVALDYGRSGADVAGIILCSALLKTAGQGMGTHIRPPVLVLQGTQDQVAPMETIAAVIAEMDKAGNDVRFDLFTQTHHAFDDPQAGTDPTARLVYSEASAQRARRAIAAFIAEVTEA
jgi:dienelactone hydrolase